MTGPPAGKEALAGFRLDTNSPDPPYRQLADRVHDLVVTGVLPLGAVIGPERRLAALLGLSRGTVARALSMLADTGLLERRVGRGTVVTFDGSLASGPTAAVPWRALLTWIPDADPSLAPDPALDPVRAAVARRLDAPDRPPGTVLLAASVPGAMRFLVDAFVPPRATAIVQPPGGAIPAALATRRATVVALPSASPDATTFDRAAERARRCACAFVTPLAFRGVGAVGHIRGTTRRLGLPQVEEVGDVRTAREWDAVSLAIQPSGHVVQVGTLAGLGVVQAAGTWISLPAELAPLLVPLAVALGLEAAVRPPAGPLLP